MGKQERKDAQRYLQQVLEMYYALGLSKQVISLDVIQANAELYIKEIERLINQQQ